MDDWDRRSRVAGTIVAQHFSWRCFLFRRLSTVGRLLWLLDSDRARLPRTMRTAPNLSPHRPHLSEVCALLATGLVRLVRHTADDVGREPRDRRDPQESSLHFVAHQSGHANPRERKCA